MQNVKPEEEGREKWRGGRVNLALNEMACAYLATRAKGAVPPSLRARALPSMIPLNRSRVLAPALTLQNPTSFLHLFPSVKCQCRAPADLEDRNRAIPETTFRRRFIPIYIATRHFKQNQV